MKVIILGSAGSGKGSLAIPLAKEFGLTHISSGNIFREAVAKKTELGEIVEQYINNGNLVPDDITIKVIFEKIAACRDGFILDGFPRTLFQVEKLVKEIGIDYAVQIVTMPETIVARLGGRYMCGSCGIDHNTRYESIDKCKACGSTNLYQRDDDKEEAILKRLEIYYKEFNPIIEYLKAAKGCKVLPIESDLNELPPDIFKKFMTMYGDELRNKNV